MSEATGPFQQEKLASIGQLAAGIAHELATPIQYVGVNLEYLEMAFGDVVRVLEQARAAGAVDAEAAGLCADIPDALRQALEGTRRASEIIRAMRSLAHPGELQPIAADVNESLASTLVLARTRIGRIARLHADWGRLPRVVCHPGLINQVFLNLLLNAADAIEAAVGTNGEHGEIVVCTRARGDGVEIEVTDSGCGIPVDIGERVFEPYFTTKAVGQGSGQGLSIARTIVEDVHGGQLLFRANGERGTTFLMRLPVAGRKCERGVA